MIGVAKLCKWAVFNHGPTPSRLAATDKQALALIKALRSAPPGLAWHECAAAGLATMTQKRVGQDTGRHGLNHGYGANANTGVMAALGAQINFLSVLVHGLAR
jgi:hypothetical protein